MTTSTILSVLAIYFSSVAFAQNACSSGVVGNLAKFAGDRAVQSSCTRYFPQYLGTPSTTVRTVTSGSTVITSTRTSDGAAVTSTQLTTVGNTITVTGPPGSIVTVTSTNTFTSVESVKTVTSGATVTTTVNRGTATGSSTITVQGSPVTTTIRHTDKLITDVFTATRTVTLTRTVLDVLSKRRHGNINVEQITAIPVSPVKRASDEEQFDASLRAQGGSSSAVFNAFCSCYGPKASPTTSTSTVRSTVTSTITVGAGTPKTVTSTITTSTTTTLRPGASTTTTFILFTRSFTTTVAPTTTVTIGTPIQPTSTVRSTITVNILVGGVSTTVFETKTVTSNLPAKCTNGFIIAGQMGVHCGAKSGSTNFLSGETNVENHEVCAALCKSRTGCQQWTFNINTNTCAFFGQAGVNRYMADSREWVAGGLEGGSFSYIPVSGP